MTTINRRHSSNRFHTATATAVFPVPNSPHPTGGCNSPYGVNQFAVFDDDVEPLVRSIVPDCFALGPRPARLCPDDAAYHLGWRARFTHTAEALPTRSSSFRGGSPGAAPRGSAHTLHSLRVESRHPARAGWRSEQPRRVQAHHVLLYRPRKPRVAHGDLHQAVCVESIRQYPGCAATGRFPFTTSSRMPFVSSSRHEHRTRKPVPMDALRGASAPGSLKPRAPFANGHACTPSGPFDDVQRDYQA
ncbi:hypothetical protein B0H14DRAFT_3519563 [Mycena olivaceomarginata]|nr:hypothetical protein B0H14DRAFT_3526915 [Mycena olivaceomarginata]KAJ7724589.1 hypothetical protein B0H14DRAFT_3519563 [Mycena olivaceomarginata]